MTRKSIEESARESAVLISRRDLLAGALTLSAGAASASVLGRQGSNAPIVSRASALRDVLAAQFRQPPLGYAPVDTYWWETGHVHEKKLISHYEEMRNEGIRGTWFYVRWIHGESLSADPTYWSDDWWALTRFSVQEHRRLGMAYYFSNWTLNQFQQDLVRKERESDPSLWGRIVAIRELNASGRIELAGG